VSRWSDAAAASTPYAWWRQGEASGTVADNAEGTAARDGTYVGAPTLDVTGLIADDTDKAVTYANGKYVTVPHLSPFDGTGAFSVAIWVDAPPSTSAWQQPWTERISDGGGLQGAALFYANTSGYGWWFSRTLDGASDDLAVATAAAGQHFVVCTYDGTNMRLYDNGALVGGPLASSKSMVTTTAPFLIGNNAFDKTADEALVWSRALSATDVATLYAAGIAQQAVTGVGGIASEEAFGTIVVAGVSEVGGIASAEAFGASIVSILALTGVGAIASAEAFGTAALGAGVMPFTWGSSLWGSPFDLYGSFALADVGAIASEEAFGTSIVTYQVFLADVGAIASEEAFGTITVAQWDLADVGAIASAEAFGTIVVLAGAAPESRDTRARAIQYHVIAFTQDGNGGPGVALAELTPEVLNLRWQVAQNLPGMAVFTLVRPNRKLALLEGMKTHVKIWRETSAGIVPIFAGKIARIMPKAADAIILAWDYKALLQLSRTGYRTLYPSKKIGSEIVSPEWLLARNVEASPFTFVTTGAIENPLGSNGSTEMAVGADFGVSQFNRLFTFYNLAEMAMANTDNNVVFDISRMEPHTFSFLRNKGAVVTALDFTFPGNLIDFDFDKGEDGIRNDRATVIGGVGSSADVEYAVNDPASIAAYRRLQDAVFPATLVGETTGTTESDQTKAIMARLLRVGIRTPRSIVLTPRQGEFVPFVDLDLGDKVRCTVINDDETGARFNGNVRVTAFMGAWSPAAGELVAIAARGLDA
jgi:hypothetical protein